MTLCINNLDAPLGAEVRGIDVSRALTAAEVEEIESAWRSRLVVVMRAQKRLRPAAPRLQPLFRRARPARAQSLTGSRSTRSIRRST